MNARFSELCTGCSRCVPQCPVRIDIPWLNQNLRQRMNQADGSSFVKSLFGSLTGTAPEDRAAPLPEAVLRQLSHHGKVGDAFARLANSSNHQCIITKVRTRRFRCRYPPRIAAVSRQDLGAIVPRGTDPRTRPRFPGRNVAVLADTFTNYGTPERGMAAVRVLRADRLRCRSHAITSRRSRPPCRRA